MKTFKNLIFNKHWTYEWVQAIEFFENWYWVSVVRFKLTSWLYGSYTDNEKEWELAILEWNNEDFHICYTTNITNDVLWHLTSSQVTNIMKKVQKL